MFGLFAPNELFELFSFRMAENLVRFHTWFANIRPNNGER